MAAGVLTLCAEKLGRVLKRFLKIRTGHAGLNGYGLVDLVKGQHFIEAASHIQRNAALYRLDAARYGAAAAVDVQGNIMLCRVSYNLLDLFCRIGIQNDIGNGVDYLMTQAENVVGCETVSDCQPVVIGDGEALLADYSLERVKMLLGKLHRVVGQVNGIKADIVGILFEVIVCELKDFLHHFVKRFLRELEELGITPAEY